MKLLITGGLGFIGSHFALAAEAAGYDVRILDSCTYAARPANLPAGYRKWFFVDIRDLELVEHHLRDFKPDAVAHLAAETHVGRSIDDPEAFLTTNVIGTHVLLEACRRYHGDTFRFLHVSTDEVYGSLGKHDPAWTEESPYAPNNPYAASKAASDHLVRSYVKTYEFPAIITHAANNYGPQQHPEKLIPTLARQCAAGQRMTLHGNGRHVRDWIHVDDHCHGLLLALQNGVPGETYNFGGDDERTNLEIATSVNGLFGAQAQVGIDFIKDRPGNDRRYAMNCLKAYESLAWKPKHTLETGLPGAVKWYLDNPNYASEYCGQ